MVDRYVPRMVDAELSTLLAEVPAVSIEGMKAVGKTATAVRQSDRTLLLDDPGIQTVVRADAAAMLPGATPLLIDEWQLVPPVWDAVRRAVDRDAKPGRFVLTGSARPASAPAHTGAGRIVQLRMRPLTLVERPGGVAPTVSLASLLSGDQAAVTGQASMAMRDYTGAIVASGLPGLLGASEFARAELLDGYIEQIIQRDVDDAGRQVRRPETLRRWLTAFAAAAGTVTSLEKVRDAAGAGAGSTPAKTTVLAYHDVLERLWIVDDVPGWSPSARHLTRVGQAPKRHLADPALAAALLGLDAERLLREGQILGQLFESLAALSVRVFAQPARARVRHLRTHGGGHEVDLVVERRDGRVVAIEVKLGTVVDDRDVGHLHWLRERVGDRLLDSAVITTGAHAYRRRDGVAVIPLELLGP